MTAQLTASIGPVPGRAGSDAADITVEGWDTPPRIVTLRATHPGTGRTLATLTLSDAAARRLALAILTATAPR